MQPAAGVPVNPLMKTKHLATAVALPIALPGDATVVATADGHRGRLDGAVAAVSIHDAMAAEVGEARTGQGLETVVAELRQQLDALVVKHAVVTIAVQELLRRVDLPTARELGRTVPARVAALLRAVADDDAAAAAQESATEELQGLLHALWR